uniref:GCF C-terminal domain-containing protein n=1 Tax=Phytophthora ramorum TaxID=164328 RepID=H3HCB2_PHYRM
MFRSKKKKVQGRKRREVEAEEGAVAANVSADIDTTYSVEIPASNDAVEAESDLQVLEELRRSRSRGSGAKSAMTFSSKSGSGLLSFDDGEKSRRDKRRKMRPNLVAATAVDVEMEGESVDQYSVEMLATLRSEQSVLLSSTTQEELEVEEGNDEEEEEFISLQGGGKKTRRMKSRVTFGVHSEDQGISKTAEVVEEVSGEEDEDNENSRRWEEELMRRGGHRVPTPAESSGNRSRDGLPTYPTRKNVSCVTLASVLGKLEKGLEATSFEDERASRELARLEAETVLIEMTLKQQQEELLVSSEEFEYFQEVEDFVKGLSFCLREKLPVIEARGKKIVEQSVQQVETKRQEELQDIAEERSARLQKYQQHLGESYVSPDREPEEYGDLFADAIDEINSLDRVYGRFQEWKAKFPEVYKNAFCELAQENTFANPMYAAEISMAQSCIKSVTSSLRSLQVRSVSLVLEEISRRGYTPHVKDALQVLVGTVLEYFSIEAKRTVLVAVGKDTSSACEEVNVFARYLLERQLSGSSYLLQILSEPSQERELKHVMELFAPFC